MDKLSLNFSDFNQDHLIGLAISIGIGFLIGTERQFSKETIEHEEQFAGIRTFTMLSIFGFISAVLASVMSFWVFGLSLIGVFAFVILAYLRDNKEPGNKGATSEFAQLITFMLGAIVFSDMILFALIIMVVILLLLTFKPSLHLFVKQLNRQELLAIILFVVMSALVMPFLPNTKFGPYGLWNLKEIWQMVVLVSGTSLIGYMIAKFMGDRGTVIAGVVGGLVSSTSVALTFSRKSKEPSVSANSSFYFAIAIISACTVMFLRVLFEVYIVNYELFIDLWLPILLISLAGFGSIILLYFSKKGTPANNGLILKNPLDLGTAIKFALLYATVQVLVKYGGEHFGDGGTYIVGAISGITDVDAITLSMAKLAKAGGDHALAINTILIAAFTNTFVKLIIVFSIGSIDLRKIVIRGFAAILLSGLAYLLLYSNFG